MRLLPLLTLLVAGCAAELPDFPRSDVDPGAPEPVLLPLSRVLADSNRPNRIDAAGTDALANRAATLRARADAMRGEVLTDRERDRLREARGTGKADDASPP
ncbi:hypothetical protein LX81_03062 [Palleronia aestuarii]|uniref:Uncharacterized protein n=1 Tax=Palleronia aestuarii TaxID=568105 RepID=A0A2W7PVW8_9RHOB|nr:hypothetical protein [Palleronia aestuarii]PZX13729.1 hypothetical protein LX81_03062 [Palleronia aestuarii]